MKYYSLLLVIGSFFPTFIHPIPVQPPRYPEVGKPCPAFLLKDVEGFRKRQVSLGDFKGKWLVLDCWNSGCTSCLESLPRVDSMAKKYNDKAVTLLIGYTGSQYHFNIGQVVPDDPEIRKMYADSAMKYNLSVPIAFDSLFFHKFDISACPYIIVIDSNGIVAGITNELTEAALGAYLAGGHPLVEKAYRTHEPGSSWMRYDSIRRAYRKEHHLN